MNPEQIEFNKFLSQHQKEASIKACLRVSDDKIKCSGKIIHAHSIQRGKILESIADVGGENEGEVYHLGFTPADDMRKATRSIDAPGRPRAGAPASMASMYDAVTWASK